MFRRTLTLSVSAIGLALATPALADDAVAIEPMDFGEWGVGLDALDTSVDPGDDFFAYVNGKWVEQTTIPADRASFGTFYMLHEQSLVDIQALVDELAASDPAPGTQPRRIVDAYNAYFDEAAIEAEGMAPAFPFLTEIFTAPDLARLAELFQAPGFPSMVVASVGLDAKDPESYAVGVNFDGMGMPDRDYYLVDSERNLALREKYREFLTFMLREAGYADPEAAARAVYAFEHKVAELEWDRAILRNQELTYNALTPAELAAFEPRFPTEALLKAGGFGDRQRLLARQLPPTEEEIGELGLTEAQLTQIGGGLPAMMTLLVETPLETLKAYMAAHFLAGNSSVLPQRIYDASFAFNGTAINGLEQPQPRWKRAIANTQSQLGEQLGALYVARYFPPEAKTRMDRMVQNLRRALGEGLASNEWMTEATKLEAAAKLERMRTKIGYPDTFKTYDGLEIRADDPLGNRIRTTAWHLADDLRKLDGPVDKEEWLMFPQQVNAYYLPHGNEIAFPAAILQPPFFSLAADPAVNYGAIGAVIGHEIGHGFDDKGSLFDSTGELRNWWQDEDRAAFVEQTDKLAPLIAAHCPVDDGKLCLKPEQSMGETLGDVVGLQLAWRAYVLSLDGQEPPVIDGLTGAQRFLLGFGQNWREKYREESLRNRVITANHPPSDFRLNNAVRHLDVFYEAFDVGPDDALYLPPEQRVKIW